MPIYEYVCESCGELVEELRGFNAETKLTTCKCGGKLKRNYSPAVIFMGKVPLSLIRTYIEGDKKHVKSL